MPPPVGAAGVKATSKPSAFLVTTVSVGQEHWTKRGVGGVRFGRREIHLEVRLACAHRQVDPSQVVGSLGIAGEALLVARALATVVEVTAGEQEGAVGRVRVERGGALAILHQPADLVRIAGGLPEIERRLFDRTADPDGPGGAGEDEDRRIERILGVQFWSSRHLIDHSIESLS